MLAGCSSTLLSPRHKLRIDASVQLQACHFHLQEKPQQKMSTQRLDLPCGFSSRKDPSRVALSVEKPGAEARGSCSFRRSSSSSSSMVAQVPPSWGATGEIEAGRAAGGVWERRRSLKRFHERGSCEDYRAKRTRTSGIEGLVDAEGEVWLPQPTQESPLEEEEKVFLVPSAASFPLPASSGHTLVAGSSAPENEFSTGEGPYNESQSDSSSSSGAYGSSPEPTKDSSGNVTSNGSRIPCSSGVADVGGEGDCSSHLEQQGLDLVSLLTSCVESVSSGNYEAMNFFLARLGEMATPLGTPIHRLVAYYTEAIAFRVVKLRPHVFSVAPPKSLVDPTEDDTAIALRLLNCVSPVLKFIHFTMNERLLKAFEGRDRVHIIDFDIKQGLQWPSLFQSLACRPNPPSHVRITGVGESRQELQDAGVGLARLAESLNLPFEFHAVVDRLEDVRLWMLHVKREECVAVNCVLTMHKALNDESGKAFMDLVSLIRSTHPEIVVMAEQEAKHNDPNWEARLARSLSYYAAIFDSIDYVLPKESQARIKIEEVFAKEIRNIVACEGSERTERHESFEKWMKLMEEGGFRCLGIGEREMLQSRMILRMYSCDRYSIDKQGEGDGLTLKWLDQPLYTVSAWAPTDIAGSSSTSQPN
ncbi:scarecrow-like protein 28 isoform X1 [Canna indica]|uniref:Scarecrow-like protein 28 isoform X1 n=1 Tax=Canna indica TaxID=4628 RepID=A0AAQ3L251_9LILI|nr:scarecrow-like protein 28 isoform X1 [Canna indica]